MAIRKVFEVEFVVSGRFYLEVDSDMEPKEVLCYVEDESKEHLLARAEVSGNYHTTFLGARELDYKAG